MPASRAVAGLAIRRAGRSFRHRAGRARVSVPEEPPRTEAALLGADGPFFHAGPCFVDPAASAGSDARADRHRSWRRIAQRQGLLSIEPLGLLAVHDMALPSQQNMQPPVTEPAPLGRQRLRNRACVLVCWGGRPAARTREPLRCPRHRGLARGAQQARPCAAPRQRSRRGSAAARGSRPRSPAFSRGPRRAGLGHGLTDCSGRGGRGRSRPAAAGVSSRAARTQRQG